ncbi:staygreen family protein [uncultured Anaerococcus sp.]|uniref:staygreen family protein n=1 Tax=uncultured Anaerococcus sp. TaxID=293428 RepID=UPI002889F0F7|nr:staygreen family protein [uncultured Anaerococcus sp.]
MEVREHESAKDLPLENRKYILAHNDQTGKLFVHILKDFGEYEFSDQLDEVFGEWEDGYFVFSCILDNEKSAYTPEGRLLIFEDHLRNSILAMIKAERKLTQADTKVKIKEIYKSKDQKLGKIIIEKNLHDFIYQDGKLVDYQPGFNYKDLAKYKKTSDH